MEAYKLKRMVWYAPERVVVAVGLLGKNIYERELLRTIFCKYFVEYRKDNRFPKTIITLKWADVEDVMCNKTYFDSMKALRSRGIIEWTSTLGRKGCQHVGIITKAVVPAIANKQYQDNNIILEADEIVWV